MVGPNSIDSWDDALSASEVYWDEVEKAYETDDKGALTVPLPPELQDWPSTRYDEFYAEVVQTLKGFIGPTHTIVTRMADLKPNRDRDKLLPWLVFFETVYREHREPYNSGDPAYQFGTDPVVMQSSEHDLDRAADALGAQMAAVNLVITMDVALCLGLKWPIAVKGSDASRNSPPAFLQLLHKEMSFTIDQFTEVIWQNLVWPYTMPPLLKLEVKTRDELLAKYPFVKGSFAPNKSSKPSSKPSKVTPSSGGSADSSSGGMWILLLLLLVAGMYLYSK